MSAILTPKRCPGPPRKLVSTPEARAEWRRIAPELWRSGRLTVYDVCALALYVNAVAEWRLAEARVREMGRVLRTPSGRSYPNPYVEMAVASLECARMMAREFGIAEPGYEVITGGQDA